MPSEAEKNLGLFVRPDGVNKPHLKQVRDKIEEWTSLINEGHLPTRSVWTSYKFQLWASVRYGLGASLASIKELEEGLGLADYYLLSKLGVVRTISKELRYIPPAYGGIGLYDLTCETTGATLNSLLQHYGTETPLGIYLTASLENMQIELGVQHCPFLYDFNKWGELATDCWVKALWEKIFTLKLEVEIDYRQLPVPRENDSFIMEALINVLNTAEATGFNRVRKHQEALTFSDICTPNGKTIDPSYLQDWQASFEGSLGRHRSIHEFGREGPSKSDWNIWEVSLQRLCFGSLTLSIPLGKWKAAPNCIWRVLFNEEEGGTLEVSIDQEGVIIYTPGNGGRFHKQGRAEHRVPRGVPARVKSINEDTLKLMQIGRPFNKLWAEEEEDKPEFMEFLRA